MKWFHNMKLGLKMILGFIIVAIIAGIVGGIGIYNICVINKNSTVLYENVTVPLTYTSEMAKLFQQIRVDTRNMLLEKDKEKIDEVYQEIEDLISQINDNADKFQKTIIAEEIKEAYKEYDKTRSDYRSCLNEFYKLCQTNKNDEAYKLLYSDMKTAGDNEQSAIDKLVDLKVDAGKEKDSTNDSTTTSTITLMIGVIAGGMLISILLGIYISRIVSTPVHKLSRAAERIADGDLNISLDIDTKDEVGMLAVSFRKMADTLNDVMTNINLAAEQVAVGSKQVSDSSIVLSQGATEQASSVEELSASLEEISSQTKQNAENADNANKLAEKAMKNAQIGNNDMSDMLKAMEDINESSNNISKIIKVIDDIAFQTNILALNAAVEAARAGQHGKGFAVVAEEVRNLAARSATAAKETTSMIEGSIKKVEGGTKIANQTADALIEIVGNITKVAQLVGNIATASNEQAAGISQVNQGVLQVSDVIQMNSSTSEESAAASEELSSQAEMLRNQVTRFKLRSSFSNTGTNRNTEQMNPDVKNLLDQMSKKSAGTSDAPQKNHESRKIILNDQDYGKYS